MAGSKAMAFPGFIAWCRVFESLPLCLTWRGILEQRFSVPPPGKVVREYLHTINENGGHLKFTKRIRPEPFTANLL